MLIKKESTTSKQNSPGCTVNEHDHPTNNLSLATSTINGRYPEQKRVTNLECEEICYVISGSGTIQSYKGTFEITEGDSYHFKIGEKYSIEGNNLKLVLINAPKWRLDQHKVVE